SGQLKRLKVLSSSLLRVKVLSIFKNILTVEVPIHFSKNFLNGFIVHSGSEQRKIIHFDPLSGTIVLDKAFRKKGSIPTAEISTREEVPVFAARLLTETGLQQSFPLIEMKLGSTRGTNALLERKGARTALLVTKGFKDLLLIGNQQRQNLFSLTISKESPLYTFCLEVNERIESDGSVHRRLISEEVKRIISFLKKRKIDSVAIALLNSYKNPIHERQLDASLRKAGFKYISLSQKLSQQIKILTRAETTVVNAYLDPIIHQYVSNIQAGLGSSSIQIMSSAGGLLEASDFRSKDSLLSGPAGGVIGALTKARHSGVDQIITFDMGGTSTDVSRCNGRPDYRFECTVGNLKIFSPSLSIETIAAGGGSICEYGDNRLTVGPHSAGASPGPACYGSNGPLTITDVNMLLGRLDEDNFPIPLNPNKSRDALQLILNQFKKKKGQTVKADDVLQSFIDIANEKMAEAIRKISIQKGHDPRDYTLLCFGGAGGQHACSIASLLG
ncbi:MAG: 5-oxoprolinase, partial [Marivirga sp.]|nr:5-oxoprolinase [Marivirga sp.]